MMNMYWSLLELREFNGFGLNKIGLKIDKNQHIKVDQNGKTNIDNIFAVGDVIGPPWLAHVSSTEGFMLLNILQNLIQSKLIMTVYLRVPTQNQKLDLLV